MLKRIAIIGLSIIIGLCSKPAIAQQKTSLNGGTTVGSVLPETGVPFLRISPDARSGGMGDVGIGLSPDANSQYWDVAKIPFTNKMYGISATYTPWLKDLVPDIFLAYIAGYFKFGADSAQAISASMRYFSLGNINYTDINAQPIGTGMPREFSFDAGYSLRLSPYLSAGASLRYIHSDIASGASGQQGIDYKPANAFAADLGMFYTKTHEIDEFRNSTFNIGAVLSNLGSKVSYSSDRHDWIPANLGIGAAYTYQSDAYNKITFAADLNKLLVPTPHTVDANGNVTIESPGQIALAPGIFQSFGDAPGGFSGEMRQIDISAGAEYWYQNQFALRAGYFYENPQNGDRKYFSCGIGVKYNIFTLNASYLVPSGSGIERNPLSNTVRFSLMFEFDKVEKQSSTTE